MSRRDEQLALCGVCWDETTFDEIPHSSVERVRSRYRHSLPELIWNTAALEGNTFTLPEVRTLLDGVTVGGRPIGDAHQILALRDAFQDLDLTVGDGTFVLSKPIGDRLHGIVAVHEAIESGHFRGEGRVQGGGTVRLSNGGVVVGVRSRGRGVWSSISRSTSCSRRTMRPNSSRFSRPARSNDLRSGTPSGAQLSPWTAPVYGRGEMHHLS